MDWIKCIFLLAGVALAACGGDNNSQCQPECDGVDCGDDGCGGSCGECTGGDVCEGGVCVACVYEPGSVCPWPAEQTEQADNLTGVGGEDFYNDLSGAVWNPSTGTLWVCRNAGPSKIWAVRRNPDGTFEIDSKNGDRGEWAEFDDLEGLTLADFSEPERLYLVAEDLGHIREVDLSTYGAAVVVNDWDVSPHLLVTATMGAEGITFVPDRFLQEQGFVDGNGSAYASTQGMGGIMLVANQADGRLYAFDLNRGDGSFVYIGSYLTEKNESCGLEFDRSTGLLYIWHGDYNHLEVARLSSQPDRGERKLDTRWVYQGPDAVADDAGNYEGIAVVDNAECADGGRSFFLTNDGGDLYSLVRYAEFPCE